MLSSYNLSGHGMNIVFILIPVRSKFQFKNRGSVIVVELPVIKYRVRSVDIRLGKCDFLRFLQSNIGRRLTVFGISRVIIVAIDGHDAGRKIQPFHRFLGADAHICQKIVAGKYRPRLQLQDNVLFVSINVIYKIARLVDLYDQIL